MSGTVGMAVAMIVVEHMERLSLGACSIAIDRCEEMSWWVEEMRNMAEVVVSELCPGLLRTEYQCTVLVRMAGSATGLQPKVSK